MPRFSVVIPTYNRSLSLVKTVESVLNQTFGNFELIIIDDGSTDNTKAVIEALDDSRIRYYWYSNSGGPATPRNKGIDVSTADWVCFLDSDDLWYPAKLEVVDKVIRENPNVDAVCHNEIMKIDISGKKQLLRYGPFTPYFYRDLLYKNRCSTSAMSVRKDFLDQHNLRFNTSPDYVIVEDYDLWLKMAFYNGIFHFIDEPLGEYIINEINISGNLERQRKNGLRLLHDHIFFIQKFDPNKEHLWRRRKAQAMLSAAIADIRQHRWKSSFTNLNQAALASPRATMQYFFSRLKIIIHDSFRGSGRGSEGGEIKFNRN